MKSLIIKIICAVLLCALTLSICACGSKTESTPTPPPATTIEENCDNGHNLVQVGYTAPTCQTIGAKVYTCSRCGYTETETLFPIDHDYQVKSTIPSTCTEKGSRLLECSMCHTPKKEELPQIEHDYIQQSSTPSTCLQFGKIIDKCSMCKDEKTISNNTLLDHNFDNTGFCSECGISKHYFNTDLNVGWFDILGRVTIDLTPLFNNENNNTADHWAAHTVYVTLICRDSYENNPPKIYKYDSKTNKDSSFFFIEGEDETTPHHCSITIGNYIKYLKTYTISIECEGFETITQTYNYNR